MYSKERMDFIIEYMSSYELKIKVANKNGLFDSAKMFELFAQEICGIYFNQKFHNLNKTKCNFPYFDLISDDGKKYIQVSTTANISSKIKQTLENIKNSKDKEYSNITEAFFFVLHNDSVKRVKNYIGKNQIGNIPFDKNKNLITTHNIITKAQNDLNFQENIYTVLKNEFENFNEIVKKFDESIEFSKNVGIKGIDTKINNEYEIDRSTLINQIREDNNKFIMIQGVAGSGKSVLCKKYLENEELILYARAEKFVEESHLKDIWDFDIKTMLDLLNGKKIIFFIDALEFIADASKSKLELLESLYYIISKYENAFIITSCRTNDKNAFIKLESNYTIKSYDVGEITDEELIAIKEKYPIIDRLFQNNSYKDLLRIPFYINIILTYSVNLDDVDNINKLRNYIWENIICIKSTAQSHNIKVSNIKKTIKKIVFERAKYFSLGIDESKFDSNIISVLHSEGIIISNKEGIRLKYDIFEDICFEYFFDNEFTLCKGNYSKFYKKIENIGRCVYRRYQIWISNKLFSKENQDKFIHCLIFSNNIPDEWKKQTEIGITKSNYNDDFFEDKKYDLIDNNLIEEYMDIINVYCFTLKFRELNDKYPQTILVPIGKGRSNLIKIIAQQELYLKSDFNREKVVKLCLDYSNQNNNSVDIDMLVCTILEYYVDISLNNIENGWFDIIEEIGICLQILFKLSSICFQWLQDLILKLLKYYNENSNKYCRVAKDILEWITENAHYNLVKELPNEMCEIANALWNEKDSENKMYHYESMESDYGLCSDYKYSFNSLNSNVLLWNLFRMNLYIGLDWAIEFINRSVSVYVSKYPDNVIKTKIKFVENEKIMEYYGNNNMWLANTREGYIPELLSDIVVNIKYSIINIVNQNLNDRKTVEKILENIKNRIYLKSNNVILLTIIESLGLYFLDEIPGYALDLASSIDIINWDTHRYSLYLNNQKLQSLLKTMLIKTGLPDLNFRYKLEEKCGVHIEDYVAKSQLCYGQNIKEKSYKILDYLYSIVSNDEEDAINHLQIQKMDMRGAKVTQINDNMLSFEPKITGEAKKITDLHKKENEPYKQLCEEINKYIIDKQNNLDNLESLVKCINKILKLSKDKNNEFMWSEEVLICLMALALKEDELSKIERVNYCNYWIDGINKILNNESFIFEPILISILIDQLDTEIDIEVKNNIKLTILKCVMNNENDHVVERIQKSITDYLQNNSKLANGLFNTIIKLSKDEMNHQKYNAKYVTEKNFQFIANITPKLYGIDNQLKKSNNKLYESKYSEIINDYLFNEKELNLRNFEVNNYDLQLLIKIVNCGLKMNEEKFESILKELLKYMIIIWNDIKENYYNDTIDIYSEYLIAGFIQRELIYSFNYSEKIIDFLFEDINFDIFQNKTIEFYQIILSGFISEFYDSYNDKKRRNICKKKIEEIEKKVNNLKNVNVKLNLYKCLFLCANRDCKWDPSTIKTFYSYEDKKFLNDKFSKYGKYSIKDAFKTIYLLNIDELLPEILISIREILLQNESNFKTQLNNDVKIIINMIITKSFIYNADKIKSDNELIGAYEDILKILISQNNEIAGVLLDEFRIH